MYDEEIQAYLAELRKFNETASDEEKLAIVKAAVKECCDE